jgi:hypothetical protein
MDVWQILLVLLALWVAGSLITAMVVGALMGAVADRRTVQPRPMMEFAAVT